MVAGSKLSDRRGWLLQSVSISVFLELLTDPAEGSLLGQIIRINYWWSGAAIYVTLPILLC